MGTEEQAFRAALDANPNDRTARLVFADWLQARDDPRATGHRALATLKKRADQWGNRPNGAPADAEANRFEWWKQGQGGTGYRYQLPSDWFTEVETPFVYRDGEDVVCKDFMTRAEAEDAAALAFSKLPADRQAELLAVEVPA